MRIIFVLALVLSAVLCHAQDLPALPTWQFWARQPQRANRVNEARPVIGRSPVVRIEHRAEQDWSLHSDQQLEVKPGDILELTADLRVQGGGDAGPSFVLRDANGEVLQWIAGFKPVSNARDWKTVTARVVIPPDAVRAQPRIIGNHAAVSQIANIKLLRKGNIMANAAKLPPQLVCANSVIAITFDTARQRLAAQDKRTGRTWQFAAPATTLFVSAAKAEGGRLEATLYDGEDDRPIAMALTLDGEKPEARLTLASSGPMSRPLRFPGALQSQSGDYLVLPMNEGISYSAEDPAIPPWSFITYGGHGLCMAFAGITDGKAACMLVLPTADDAGIQLGRTSNLNWMAPSWDSQKGQFGYERQMRLILLEEGGHVAMAKRYRQYAKETGLLKTLAEKRKDRPQIDKLIGAANIWCWDANAAAIARELQEAGMGRMLWSNQVSPEQIRQLNALPNVLSSRYDIYQDLMDPKQFPNLRYTHPDWTTAGFPHDIILDASGKAIPGWEIERKDGKGMVPCAVLCDLRAPQYAVDRIGKDLQDHPYGSRFVDTTTAAPWRECYSPAHPMTRTQSRIAKMQLLEVVSGKHKLVCGSETGHDAAVPYCDYFEGMLSLGPYRVPDSGRDMQKIYTQVPPDLAKFQVGEKYRLPLWELVYHDCVVAQWYWGDYNNKLPAIWRKRDLFNALYGTPPMYMFTPEMWRKDKQRFAQSYKTAQPVARATGYSEMTDHRFLTPDRSVQQTTFANGVIVTVNFGDEPFAMADGEAIAPMDVRMEHLPTEAR